jgi:hypothetical protein
MICEDVGRNVDIFVKRTDGRVFVYSGVYLGSNDTHHRLRINGVVEEVLRSDIQRVIIH